MPGGGVRSARRSAPSTDSTRSESGRRSQARTAPVRHGSPGQPTVKRSVDHRHGEERARAAKESADGVGTTEVWPLAGTTAQDFSSSDLDVAAAAPVDPRLAGEQALVHEVAAQR